MLMVWLAGPLLFLAGGNCSRDGNSRISDIQRYEVVVEMVKRKVK